MTLAAFLSGWLVMLAAMMLSTTLPLVRIFSTITSDRKDRELLSGLVLAGYLCVWALFGVVILYGQEAGLLLLPLWAEGVHAMPWVSAASSARAGIFQYAPIKYRCLDKCRSPLSQVIGRWRGTKPAVSALRLGIDHGLYCVGCCWALMLLMFLVGAGSIGWMLGLGALMALEKNFPWGARLAKPLGSSLLLSGILVMIW